MYFSIPSLPIYKTLNKLSIKIEKRSPKTYLNLFLEKYFSRYDIVDFLISYFTTFLALGKCGEGEKSRGLKLWLCNESLKMLYYAYGLKKEKTLELKQYVFIFWTVRKFRNQYA